MTNFNGTISGLPKNFCLSLLSLCVFLAVGEGFFRVIDYDFAGEAQAWLRIPIYYRQPIAPTGEAFFKRPGSERWTGQVLCTRLKQLGVVPNPYSNEPEMTIDYDCRGFRNPNHLSDWAIAVAGDSFTELGYLPDEQLFTSILARKLKVAVLNLGTSYTGPLTQLSYLKDYGTAASTEHTVIVFFEGNDLEDLASEYSALLRWKETGQRDFREFNKQPSLLKALHDVVGRVKYQLMQPTVMQPTAAPISAYFKPSQKDLPVTLNHVPPGRAELSSDTMQQLDYFFQQYADFTQDSPQITAWFAYMPSKRRVLHGQLTFTEGADEDLKNWQPTDLPEVISELCSEHGIQFIDLTPALVKQTNHTQQLLYNSIYDTHLNSQGSFVVGQELARQLASQLAAPLNVDPETSTSAD